MMKRSAFTRTLASVLTLVMLLALAVGFCACAREKDDGITPLTVTEENRHLVGFTGAVDEELVIPETIEVDGRQYRITVIDDYAFYDCINLISVTLPESVMQIRFLRLLFLLCTQEHRPARGHRVHRAVCL